MKKISYILGVLLIAIISCNNSTQNTNESGYCSNELKLLCNDSLAPNTDYNLLEIRNEIWKKLDSIFTDYHCEQLSFKVNFEIDSVRKIKLLLYSRNFKNCNENQIPPPFNPYVHWFHAYLKQNDTIYIRRRISSIDSVKNEVIKRYKELEIQEYSKVYIALLWDNDTDKEKITNIVNGCIEGYLVVANSVSLKLYKKLICELNDLELENLNETIPFKLRTDFLEEYDDYDFVPSQLPLPIEEVNDELRVLNN